MKNPPQFATWLLRYLAAVDDAVAGDLVEEYQRGRSALWYWRQITAAILVGASKEIRAHPVLVARSVAVGCTVAWGFSIYAAPFIVGFDQWLFERGVRWFYMHGYRIPAIHGLPWIVNASVIAVAGNLAVRSHGRRSAAMAVIFAGAIFVGDVVMWARWLYYALTMPPPPYGLVLYSSYELSVVALCILPAAALVGGLWATRGLLQGR